MRGECREGSAGRRRRRRTSSNGAHVIASTKHFLADGGTTDGRDQGDRKATETELRDIHAAGYVPAHRRRRADRMASFSSWQGVEADGHQGLLTDVLKERMGFDGFSSATGTATARCRAAPTTTARSAQRRPRHVHGAGQLEGSYDSTLAQVKRGDDLRWTRLDEAVRRILRVKFRAGLFEAPSAVVASARRRR